MSDADPEKSMDYFGGKNSERGILVFILRHGTEHLGNPSLTRLRALCERYSHLD